MLLQERQVCNCQFVVIFTSLPVSACNVHCLASSHTFTIHKQIKTIIHPTGGWSKMTYSRWCIYFPFSFTNLFSPPGTTLITIYLSLQQLTPLFLMVFVFFILLVFFPHLKIHRAKQKWLQSNYFHWPCGLALETIWKQSLLVWEAGEVLWHETWSLGSLQGVWLCSNTCFSGTVKYFCLYKAATWE